MEYQGKALGCPPLTTAHHEEVHLSRLGLWKEALKVPNGLWRGPRGGNRGQPWALSDLQLMSAATQAAPQLGGNEWILHHREELQGSFFCPWDSPGKNTGTRESAQSCLTLRSHGL